MALDKLLTNILSLTLKYFTEHKQYDFLKECLKYTKKEVTAEKMLEMNRYIYKRPDLQFYADLTEIATREFKKNLDFYTNIYIEFFKNQYLSYYQEVMQISESKISSVLPQYMSKIRGKVALHSKEIYTFICFAHRFKNCEQLQKECERFNIGDMEYTSNKDIHYSNVCSLFCDEVVYEEYIKECRKLLAQSLNISESKLNDKIYTNMIQDIKTEGDVCNFSKGLVYTYIQSLMANDHGGSVWFDYSLIDNREDKEFRELKYHPDVERIIENYYQSKIIYYFAKNMPHPILTSEKVVILVKEIVESEDYLRICDWTNYDVLYHLFSFTLKKLYEEKLKFFFSETQSNEVPQSGKDESLKTEIEQLKKEKQALYEENFRLKDKLYKTAADRDALQTDWDNLIGDIDTEYRKYAETEEGQENEAFYQYEESQIERLTRELKERNELIANGLSDTEEPIEETEEINLGDLYSYRFLFVGNLEVAGLPQLKWKFPKSIFFETESTDINGVSIDYIVLLIKYMNHGMFNKLDSVGGLRNKPRIYFNAKNITTLLNTMYRQIHKYALEDGHINDNY